MILMVRKRKKMHSKALIFIALLLISSLSHAKLIGQERVNFVKETVQACMDSETDRKFCTCAAEYSADRLSSLDLKRSSTAAVALVMDLMIPAAVYCEPYLKK